MRLAQPPGIRSCKEGGTWRHCLHEKDGGHALFVELRDIFTSAAEADREALRQELRAALAAAEEGMLDFGPDGRVDQMQVVRDVLEIRLNSHLGEAGRRRHVRVYFSEPDKVPRRLLSLKIASKLPGPIGLGEQNAHAREA